MLQKPKNSKKIFIDISIILFVSILIAFISNHFSPNGIAFVGRWDTNKGLISAVKKNDGIIHKREVQTLNEAKKLYDKNYLFIDARDLHSYNEGHIKGAISFPYYEFDKLFDKFIDKYPLDTKMVTYCNGRECRDSVILAEFFYDAGYENIYVFIDGFPLWQKQNLPIETLSD